MRRNFLKTKLHVAAYAELGPEEVSRHAPKVVLLGDHNAIQSIHEQCITPP